MPGISKYNWWEWPIEGTLAGYILACPLSNIGKMFKYSPSAIEKLCNSELKKPEPNISDHSQSNKKWLIPHPSLDIARTSDTDLSQTRPNILDRNEIDGKIIICIII